MTPPRTGPPLEDAADALARQGRFAEAVHHLLLDAVHRLSLGGALPEHLTSREVAAKTRLPAPARSALDDLVGGVEASLFGGRPLDEASWKRCREAHVRLAATLQAA
jgi:hypothetical protein